MNEIFSRSNLARSVLVALVSNVLTPASSFSQSSSELKKLSVEGLMDIEVTSVSKRPEKLSEAASAIQVVNGEDIRRSGASSIPEALRLASNLQVAQKNSQSWGISARGFNTDLGNKLLVLVDGRTVYTPLYSGVYWDVQDYLLEDVDRIEVISGPGGSLWGANAVNGVINIISKSAKDTQGAYVEGGGGSELRGFGGARFGGTLASNVYYRVYGKYFDRDDSVFPNGNEAGDAWNMGRGGFRMDAEMSLQNTFTLQGDYYAGREGVITGGKTDVAGGNVLGRWSHAFSEDSDMSLQFYYDRTHMSVPKPAFLAVPAGTLADDLDTYDLDFQHRFRLGERNHFVWGLGYRFTHDVVENAPSVVFVPAKLNQELFSGFVQDEIMLLEKLQLTLGTKLEHNDYTGYEVEPSGRLQWNATPNHMFWGAVSRAVRTPSRIDRDFQQPTGLGAPFNNLFAPGTNFTSETLIAYELGYRVQLATKASASISGFYNEYDDVRSSTPHPTFGFPLVFQNNLEGETYGFELSAAYQPVDWWRLRVGYNLLKEDIRIQSGRVDFSGALNETADPQHQFSLRSSLDVMENVELDAGLRWVDTLHNNNGPTAGTVPSYFELDVRLAWRPTARIELSIVGQNLLHDQHPEFGFPSPTRTEIQRSVYGKVSLRW